MKLREFHPDSLLATSDEESAARPLWLVERERLDVALAALPSMARDWARHNRFRAAPGECLPLPDARGVIRGALAGLGARDEAHDPLASGAFRARLPAGVWRLDLAHAPSVDPEMAMLGWMLDTPARGRAEEDGGDGGPRLLCPPGVDRRRVEIEARATWLARDLVNMPANHMGPAQLADVARRLARDFNAQCRQISGARLRHAFPLVHAVGAAATEERAPRLVELRWNGGGEDAPLLGVVGKGVCFDTGGLDIKPSSAMRLMKKDMGGAAAALALALMIMAARLPVRLLLLLPIVENAVSAGAMRPGDVLRGRAGLEVEVGNTDAEGRLILADALSAADEERCDLLIDFATLTGAARVALGPQLPALFASDEALAWRLARLGRRIGDPLWPLPLWRPYAQGLESDVADLGSIAQDGFAGAIVAALFLKRFVSRSRWLHMDIYAWNPTRRPARPKGGELQGARAAFALLRELYATREENREGS